ncbi:MAG: sulfurtransferase [Geitlerinemataceae cyanobacterium]
MTQSLLISPTDLARAIESDRPPVVVDCRFTLSDPDRGERDYLIGHIPDAAYLSLDRDLSAPVQQHGGRHPLPSIAAMEATFSRLGIKRGVTNVVAYDDSRFAFAARLWWMLRYCGHDRVSILDGGFPAWTAAGLPVTADVPSVEMENSFAARTRSDWIATREDVLAASQTGEVAIVDSRSPARYRGETEPIDPYAGHVPGAIERFWQGVTDETGAALPAAAQRQRWDAIADCERAIVYCGSGVTACVNLLSLELAREADPAMPTVAQLYAGSWSDWCSYAVSNDDPTIARG